MWWLEKTRYFEERRADQNKGTNRLGMPQNEREVRLLEMVLNRHHDYIRKRQREEEMVQK